jgi:hypothetical protein
MVRALPAPPPVKPGDYPLHGKWETRWVKCASLGRFMSTPCFRGAKAKVSLAGPGQINRFPNRHNPTSGTIFRPYNPQAPILRPALKQSRQ